MQQIVRFPRTYHHVEILYVYRKRLYFRVEKSLLTFTDVFNQHLKLFPIVSALQKDLLYSKPMTF